VAEDSTPLSRDELIARYGQPEPADAAAVLRLLGEPEGAAHRAMAYRYPSVEAFEAYALANRVRNRIGDHGIGALGPAVADNGGVFGVLLLPPDSPRVVDVHAQAREDARQMWRAAFGHDPC